MNTEEAAGSGPSRPPDGTSPRLLRPRTAALLGLGLLVGLALAEGAFWWRDRGAFPHLNVYAPDPQLAVRLEAGASELVALPGNPVTHVRINVAGLRGELPPPSNGEIVVVGDSQVFGLGVEEAETMSAELGRLLGVPTVNAGVPTYGPLEYEAVVDRLLRERRPSTVVYVVNFSNDLFEVKHPNTERHGVWDGWAVRKETMPRSIQSFPGRRWLFGQSHLFYAARGWWYGRKPALDGGGFRSEGGARDLLDASQTASAEHAHAEQETEARARAHTDEIQRAIADELRAELKLEKIALGINEIFTDDSLDTFTAEPRRFAYRQSLNNPGDIVYRHKIPPQEGARQVSSTIALVMNGAKVRREVEAKLRAKAEEKVKEAESKAILATFEEREALRARIAALRAAPSEIIRAWSPMTPALRSLKKRCDEGNARLVVVALPMDVQVSAAEGAKFGPGAEVDMTSTRILLDDLVSSAEALGALAVNALPALGEAEPGAFLPNDLHLTPKGHRAVAAAIARKLQARQ